MKVKFLPSDEEHEIEPNETILHLAQREGLHIQSVCKGLPSCAECKIQVVEGEHHVLPPSSKELQLIGTAHYVDMSRLACQLRCFGDVTVDLSQQIAKEERVSKKPHDRMARKDGQDSKAVLGGILDNVVAADAEVSEEFSVKAEKVEVAAFKGDPNLDRRDSFYGDFYTGKKKKKKSNNKSNNKNRGNDQNKPNRKKQSTKSAVPSSSDEAGKTKKKRSRNRNRKRPGQGQGTQPSKSND